MIVVVRKELDLHFQTFPIDANIKSPFCCDVTVNLCFVWREIAACLIYCKGFPLTSAWSAAMMTNRVRGLKAFLADSTNIPPTSPSKRFCAEKAKNVICDELKIKANRG